jgi:peptidyl-prolyl cis-trans isomerase C
VNRTWLEKAIREPLVHFLLAGGALFAVMGQFGSEDSSDRSITIDEAQVARLASQWEQTWRRPPSPKELDSVIRDHIKEEIYYREAIRLGLDADDPIIRRRLRTKMEYLATAQAENTPPTDAELNRYYMANKASYAADPVYSFDQRYYGDDEAGARSAVAALNARKSPPALPISLPAAMEKASASEIAKTFGDGFADGLAALPTGKWAGPAQSGFGWHAVRIRSVDASNVPPLAEIRQRVTNDWRAQMRAAREAAAYQALLDGYDISIAKP